MRKLSHQKTALKVLSRRGERSSAVDILQVGDVFFLHCSTSLNSVQCLPRPEDCCLDQVFAGTDIRLSISSPVLMDDSQSGSREERS